MARSGGIHSAWRSREPQLDGLQRDSGRGAGRIRRGDPSLSHSRRISLRHGFGAACSRRNRRPHQQFPRIRRLLPQPPRAAAHAKNALRPDYTSGSGAHYLAPADAATIYNFGPLYQKGYDGTGQTLAVVGQSAINLSDIENFRTIFGLAKNDPKLVTVPNLTTPGIVAGDVIESDLDLEWAGAVARGANLIFVYTSNAFNSLQYAVSQNLAPVISISYGACETGAASEAVALRQIAQQANAEGITVLSASGDTGAFACDASGVAVATHGVSVTLPPASRK